MKDKKLHQSNLEVTIGKLVFLANGNNLQSKYSKLKKMQNAGHEALRWNGIEDLAVQHADITVPLLRMLERE